jgi:biopolymer transport protein ExbB
MTARTRLGHSQTLKAATRHGLWLALAAAALLTLATTGRTQQGNQPGTDGAGPAPNLTEAERRANEALSQNPTPAGAAGAPGLPPAYVRPSLLELFIKGGWMMIPIAVMALVAIVFGIERLLAIRRAKLMPPPLVELLGAASMQDGGLDPRKVYKACQQFPSAASSVIRATMLKVGRPHSEVEHTVKDALEREADLAYRNIRPITLSATVSPLLGLLGTVWGMVDCFARTASGAVGRGNRAEQLADGIYTALMTTFFGLVVAIPASMLAHYLEGRIQALFREIDELMLNMLPQMEQFEGKLRVRKASVSESHEPAGRKSEVGSRE